MRRSESTRTTVITQKLVLCSTTVRRYSGVIGGSHYNHKGSGANSICLHLALKAATSGLDSSCLASGIDEWSRFLHDALPFFPFDCLPIAARCPLMLLRVG